MAEDVGKSGGEYGKERKDEWEQVHNDKHYQKNKIYQEYCNDLKIQTKYFKCVNVQLYMLTWNVFGKPISRLD